MQNIYQNKDWLESKYLEKQLSTYQISRLTKTSQGTIRNWFKKYNIPCRSIGEAQHLIQANHCVLTKEAVEWINGELMGDACLWSQSPYSAHFKYGSKYLEYIKYISSTLTSFGIKQAGKIRKQYGGNGNLTYQYQSYSYEELLSIYDQWYPKPNRKKIIPKDVELTPLTLRQEYIGDGCLQKPKKWGRPYVTLATCGFLVKDVEWLILQLNKLGLKATQRFSRNEVEISTYSTKDFLDYIGECPVECYQYKWDYEWKVIS